MTRWPLTPQEVAQIVRFLREDVTSLRPVDKRRLTKNARKYLLTWRLTEDHDDGRLYARTAWTAAYDLQPEILWAVVEPMLKGAKSIGRSIAKHPDWEVLNIWPEGRTLATSNDLGAQMDVLDVLAAHAYIYFQHAGTVWEIARRDHAA